MRKLIYVQTDEPVGSFCVIRVNGQRLFAEVTGTKSAARVLKLGDFRFDTKYSIELQITVNTAPGTPDGILRVWKDGTLAIEVNDVNWINARSRGAAFSRFLFGQQTQGTKRSLFHEYRYWDNLAISTRRIGP